MYVDIFNIPEGTILRSTKHGNVTLGKCVPNLGSFGVVYKGTLSQEGENIPVAVKFLAESDETSATDEIRRKERARFKHEIEMLEMFCGEYEPFPIIFRNGTYHGVPFYVMEYLEPVNLLTLDTDDKRFEYVDEVCGAVEVLHNKGYVHYDIKPANIMIRRGSSVDQYVLADFGSVHKVETTDSPILPSDKTISMLENGSRMYPHTPGYADPLDDRHTVNSDIYAIGQVIRDTFSEEVSPTWARIIDKCTSRNTEYSYQSVSCIIRDLNNLKRSAYSLAAADDFHIWNAQKKVVNEEQVAMTWPEFKWELASCRATLPDDDDYPEQAGVFAPDREVFIDFGRLKHRNILITTPIRMTESCLLVVQTGEYLLIWKVREARTATIFPVQKWQDGMNQFIRLLFCLMELRLTIVQRLVMNRHKLCIWLDGTVFLIFLKEKLPLTLRIRSLSLRGEPGIHL